MPFPGIKLSFKDDFRFSPLQYPVTELLQGNDGDYWIFLCCYHRFWLDFIKVVHIPVAFGRVELHGPLSIRKVFPSNAAEKKRAEASGGIQYKEKEMATYLNPIMATGQSFLQQRNITNVPLYLLATGGMREQLGVDNQNAVLRAAHGVMSDWQGTFSVGQWETNTRVIPGSVEGLYGWLALNYGRGAEEQTNGLLEIGGASMQIAYQVPEVQITKQRVCLLSGEHRVFSKTWDGFGADSSERPMLAGLLADAGGANGTCAIKNPCLPVGQVSSPIGGTNRTTTGSGEFASCLRLARGVLQEGLKTRDPIPSYLDIASYSKHFYGISSYWYNYQFFAKWGGYDVNRAYDRKAFTDAVTKYCSSNWDEILWAVGDTDRTAPFNEHICWNTAWMLTLLHDDKYGFGLEMTQYDTWTSLFRFPTTTDLALRSSWTIGAAALIARHGVLSFCPTNASSTATVVNKTLEARFIVETIPQLPSSPQNVHRELASEGPGPGVEANTYEVILSSYNLVFYGVVFLLLAIITYQWRRTRASCHALQMTGKNVSLV